MPFQDTGHEPCRASRHLTGGVKIASAWPKNDAVRNAVRATGDWLLRVDPERLISIGRLVTSIFAILAVFLDPTRPFGLLYESRAVLCLYLLLSLLLVFYPLRKPFDDRVHLVIHLIDAIILGWLTFLTNELTSPFFDVLAFVLLATTLRWGLKGAAYGALILLVVQLVVGLPDLLDGESELNVLIMRSTYFIFLAVILGYFGAYRERSRRRLALLAEWPFDAVTGDQIMWLELMFKHASNVLGGSRLIVVWRDQNEDTGCAACWSDGKFQLMDITQPDFWRRHDVQAPDRQGEPASSSITYLQLTDLIVDLPGLAMDQAEPFGTVFAASFTSVRYRGQVYVIHASVRPDEGGALTEIIARRIGSELERLALVRETTEAARSEERMRLAGDLHDSVIQNLTAARLKLKLACEGISEEIRPQIEEAGSLIFEQQQLFRQFVDDNRAVETSSRVQVSQTLREYFEVLEELWNCHIEVALSPHNMVVPKWTEHEIMQLVSEAAANAVRHGAATRLDISIVEADNTLILELIDNGSGTAEGAQSRKPSSLAARVDRLGGGLEISKTSPGFGVRIEMPLRLELR